MVGRNDCRYVLVADDVRLRGGASRAVFLYWSRIQHNVHIRSVPYESTTKSVVMSTLLFTI